MANAQVFTCNYGGSIKNKLLKSGEKLFLKIEDGKISGKAFICNEEGRNGYIDNFDYPINDVREVFKGEYQGNTALIMNTRLTSLYGTKKAQTIFPSMKDIDIVIEKIGQMKESHGGANATKEVRQATTQSQPIARPTTPAPAPAPASNGGSSVAPAPVPKRMETPSQNVVIKQESPVREEGGNVGSAILTRNPQLQQQQAAPVVSQNKIDYEAKKIEEREKRKVEKEIKKLEEQIDALEKELAILDDVMANPSAHPEIKIDDDFYWNYGKKKEDLQYLIDKWGEIAM